MKQLLPFVVNLAPNWYEVGAMLLEVEQESQLKLIQASHGSDVRKCCLSMLQYWMDTHPKATWLHLVTALISPGVNLATVAYDIEKNFIGKMNVVVICVTIAVCVCLCVCVCCIKHSYLVYSYNTVLEL